MYKLYISKASQYFDLTKTRQIYESAMENLQDDDIPPLAIRYGFTCVGEFSDYMSDAAGMQTWKGHLARWTELAHCTLLQVNSVIRMSSKTSGISGVSLRLALSSSWLTEHAVLRCTMESLLLSGGAW